MNAAVVVGVAGKCCAGKDEVTAWLRARGWREVNVDRIGHEALEAQRDRIVEQFGEQVLAEDGTIDRGTLGTLVFRDAAQRRALEAIVHPWMRSRVREVVDRFRADAGTHHRWLTDDTGVVAPFPEGAPGPGLVINAALLFPMQLDRLCDVVLLVTAPLHKRLVRAYRRDGLTARRIFLRLLAQRGLDTQAYRSPAETITVENAQSREALYRRLESLETFHDG